MAGVAGFEPAHGGTKNRCLTAWLHPNDEQTLLIFPIDCKPLFSVQEVQSMKTITHYECVVL